MRTAPSPLGAPRADASPLPAGSRRTSRQVRPAMAGAVSGTGRSRTAKPGATLAALTTGRQSAPDGRTERSGVATGPAPRRVRVDEHQRSVLGDLSAALAAVAAACVALALVALPSAPTGVGVAAGAIVSFALGWAAVTVWSRWAVAGGAPGPSVRRHAVVALVLAHVVAAVPVGVAVVLAG